MLEFSISKRELINPLMLVAAAVDKKQSLAVLSNILFSLTEQQLVLRATDLEIEIAVNLSPTSVIHTGTTTVPARKLVDIVRSLEDDALLQFTQDEKALMIRAGRSHFKLQFLPADQYPHSADEPNEFEFSVPRQQYLQLLQMTHFAMSQQDHRFFLNALLMETEGKYLSTVATDGHRMAVARLLTEEPFDFSRILIPKKAVQEMIRLLTAVQDETVLLSLSRNQISLSTKQVSLASKLLEARYPPYQKLIPKAQDKFLLIDRDLLRRALARIVVLANEKSKAVVFHMQEGQLHLIAHNAEQEEAFESLEAETEGDEIKIGINSSYLADVLAQLPEGLLRIAFSDRNSSILVDSPKDPHYQYIIMPMKI